MLWHITLFTLVLSTRSTFADNDNIHVYAEVPGLAPSPYYSFRVRELGSDEWLDTFALVTECTAEKFCNTTGAYEILNGWSNTYINFEMRQDTAVEVKITKLFGGDLNITKAVVHPYTAADDCRINQHGKAVVTISKPGLFTVDINGQMDDQDTGRLPGGSGFYQGPPIHTLTIFANPFLEGKPDLSDEGVYQVKPGETAPTDGDWHTLYFLPGLHDIGVGFLLQDGKDYYIPGEAVVYGTMNNNKGKVKSSMRIFGHGTLSGDKLPHPSHADPPLQDDEYWTYHPIDVSGAHFTTVEGITVANSPYHSVMLGASYNPNQPTDMRWLKIFTWRANGDGINPFRNGLVEDCFIRTQDDSTYVTGRGIRRVVYWNDFNGSTFVLNPVGKDNYTPIVVEDCTIVYQRAKWNHWSGGRVWNMRGEGGGTGGDNIVFRNIMMEDPRPTLQQWMIAMEGFEPYSDPSERKREPGDLVGIIFQNITIAAPSVLGEPDSLWGMSDGIIYDLQFDNVVVGGKKVEGIDHFHHNEYVLP